jgi:hypothetical protein
MACSSMMEEMSMQMPSYEVHDFKVYFGNQYLPDARWSDFIDLGQGYGMFLFIFLKSLHKSALYFLGKDSHHVFFMGQLMGQAHPFSFEVLNQGYAKDKNYVFQHGQIIEGLKPIGFRSL